MNRNRLFGFWMSVGVLGIFAFSAVTLVGCGGRQEAAGGSARAVTADRAPGEFAEAEWQRPAEEPGGEDFYGANSGRTRKLVKSAELHLRVDNPEAAEPPLMEIVEKYGAYTASVRISGNSRRYTIRAPSASYEPLLAELNGIGKILYRTESAEDVTLRYYDLEGRLETKRELLKTFQGYLGKAQNIEEIMTVETRIAELQREIDWTGTELRSLADLVDYATVDLELRGPSALPSAKPALGDRIADLFRSFGDYASVTLVVLTGIVIYGVPGVLILAFLFWLLFGRIGLLRRLWYLAAASHGEREKPRDTDPRLSTVKNGGLKDE
ncbi:MAG: DUF4349 domain-containing protein [Spirochaetaceae bacterium]|jgi:hypothetical protein|nr:DUF4349 domain-containing protein [Spirochaetaceae bacterium]